MQILMANPAPKVGDAEPYTFGSSLLLASAQNASRLPGPASDGTDSLSGGSSCMPLRGDQLKTDRTRFKLARKAPTPEAPVASATHASMRAAAEVVVEEDDKAEWE